MQAQTIHKGPPAQPSVLPPLQNLPSWSRSSLERRRQPRPIVRDQQSIDPLDEAGDDNDIGGMVEHQKNVLSLNEPRIVSAPSRTGEKDLRQKVTEMEKSLDFVQNEHAQVLKNLHEEIERLKAENKDLNFKLVMSRSGVNVEEMSPVPSEESGKLPQSHHKPLNEKQSSAKKQSKSSKSASESLDKIQKQTTESKQNTRNSSASAKKRHPSGSKSSATPSSAKKPVNPSVGSANKSKFLSKARAKQHEKEEAAKAGSPVPPPQSPVWSSIHGGQQMIMVTLSKDKMIQVHVPNETGARSPTLSECKTIIAEQQETNHKQARELLKLRTDLRDAKLILAKKLNQTNYPEGKSYSKMEASQSNSGSNIHSNRHLPQLPFREPVNSGRLPARPAPSQPEKFTLPSLRPNINSGVADRRRRQQAILRGRAARPNFY